MGIEAHRTNVFFPDFDEDFSVSHSTYFSWKIIFESKDNTLKNEWIIVIFSNLFCQNQIKIGIWCDILTAIEKGALFTPSFEDFIEVSVNFDW